MLGFQYFSNLPVLHYLIKIGNIFLNILYNTIKSGGTKDHFRWVNVPGTTRY